MSFLTTGGKRGPLVEVVTEGLADVAGGEVGFEVSELVGLKVLFTILRISPCLVGVPGAPFRPI